MNYHITNQSGQLTIRPQGRMTFRDHEAFQTLALLLTDDLDHVVIDLTEVSTIDSSALGMLLILHDEVRRLGATLRLCGASAPVRRLFLATDIGKTMPWDEPRPGDPAPTAAANPS